MTEANLGDRVWIFSELAFDQATVIAVTGLWCCDRRIVEIRTDRGKRLHACQSILTERTPGGIGRMGVMYLKYRRPDIESERQASVTDAMRSHGAMFDVTLDMVRMGVEKYLAFDPEEDEPETLVAEILFAARDMWRRAHSNGNP